MSAKRQDWTTKELADVAGVTVQFIGQEIRDGNLAAHKRGGRWRITDQAARGWLRGRKGVPEQPEPTGPEWLVHIAAGCDVYRSNMRRFLEELIDIYLRERREGGMDPEAAKGVAVEELLDRWEAVFR